MFNILTAFQDGEGNYSFGRTMGATVVIVGLIHGYHVGTIAYREIAECAGILFLLSKGGESIQSFAAAKAALATAKG